MSHDNEESMLPALRDLKRWWTQEDIGGVVIGGVAISMVAGPRFTEDVDCIVDLENRDWADFLNSGEPFGFVPRIENPVEFAKRSRVLLLRHSPSDTSVDVSVAGILFELEAIERGRPPETALVDIPVATAEDLLIMKAVARRQKDRVDMVAIIKAHKNLDTDRIRNWASLFSEGLEEPEILEGINQLLESKK
jgi:hypothetical protein